MQQLEILLKLKAVYVTPLLKPTRGYHLTQSQSKALQGPALSSPASLGPSPSCSAPAALALLACDNVGSPLLRAFAHAIPTS